MDTGFSELQIFISLVVVLGTAFVALVVDYLKGNNERLREYNVELRTRREEQDRYRPLEAVQWLQNLLVRQREFASAGAPLRRSAPAPNPKPRPAPVEEAAPFKPAPTPAFKLRKEAAPAPPPPAAEVPIPRPAVMAEAPAAPAAWAAEPPSSQRLVFMERKPEAAPPPPAAVVDHPPEMELSDPQPPEFASHDIEPESPPVAAAPGWEAPLPEPARLPEPAAAVEVKSQSLLDSLPKPEWLVSQKQAGSDSGWDVPPPPPAAPPSWPAEPPPPVLEAQSAANDDVRSRLSRWESGRKEPAAPAAALPPLSEPAAVQAPAPVEQPAPPATPAAPARDDNFWTYRGLLDRVVAEHHGESPASAEPPPAEPPPSERMYSAEPTGSESEPLSKWASRLRTSRDRQRERPADAGRTIPSWVDRALSKEDAKKPAAPAAPVPDPSASAWEPFEVEPPQPEPAVAQEPVLVPEVDSPQIAPPAADMIPAGAALETTAEAAPKAPHEESWEAPSIHDLVDHLPEPEPELEPEPESPPVPLVALEPAAEPRIEEPAEAEPIEEPAAALVSALPAPEPELPATPPLAVADLLDPDPLPQALAVPAPPPEAAKLPGPAETLPAGYHDRGVLTSLMQRSELINGVVVAIGINEYQHNLETMGRQAMQDLMRSVEEMVQSLLGGADFACRSNDDEFILFFPGETGAAAQRRLTTISERLWNFQLRSITSFSVLFSWGAVETQGETLADAVASASERMYQTKRNRRASEQRRKLAVNL